MTYRQNCNCLHSLWDETIVVATTYTDIGIGAWSIPVELIATRARKFTQRVT